MILNFYNTLITLFSLYLRVLSLSLSLSLLNKVKTELLVCYRNLKFLVNLVTCTGKKLLDLLYAVLELGDIYES